MAIFCTFNSNFSIMSGLIAENEYANVIKQYALRTQLVMNTYIESIGLFY